MGRANGSHHTATLYEKAEERLKALDVEPLPPCESQVPVQLDWKD